MDLPGMIGTLWRTALVSLPLALVVWGLCRALPLRSSTRHALWVVVLAVLVGAPLLPGGTLRDVAARVWPAPKPPIAAAPIQPPPAGPSLLARAAEGEPSQPGSDRPSGTHAARPIPSAPTVSLLTPARPRTPPR